jgi:chemotaxis protein CheD
VLTGAAVNERSTSMPPPVRMGALAVSQNDVVLRTLLGSCIGVVLYDRKSRVGGLAHVVLPQSQGPTETPGKFMDTAIPALCRKMEECAGGALKPSARIAGGAAMFATSGTETIGMKNIEAAERWLKELRIPVVARHCGGEQGRRVSLDTTTGVVTVEIVGCDPVEL